MSLTDALNSACLAAFGETVTYTPQGGSAASVKAIVEAGDDFETRVPGAEWSLWVCLADVSAPAKGDSVTASGLTGVVDGTYRVVDVRKDGSGGAWLDLQFIRT